MVWLFAATTYAAIALAYLNARQAKAAIRGWDEAIKLIRDQRLLNDKLVDSLLQDMPGRGIHAVPDTREAS